VATLAVTRRFDLTDAQWAILEPLLPAPRRPGRPSNWTKRQLIDGIRWRVRVGAPWRDVPGCYGSWQAVYALFRRWQRGGVWAGILATLQVRADAAGLIGWQVGVDSTIMRAHQHAAGARRHRDIQRETPGGVVGEPADHALGRSRGGLSTKLHLACEGGQKPLSLVLSAGQAGNAPRFEAVMAGVRVARPRRWPPPDPAGPGTRRQGVFVPRHPRTPAATRHRLHHSRARRPDRSLAPTRQPGHPSVRLRPR